MLTLNGHTIYFKSFPNGETFADISQDPSKSPLNFETGNIIGFKFEDDKDIFNLVRLKALVDDVVYPSKPCYLNMPYIPYSRMDRAEEDRLFSLKYFAQLINSLNFTNVCVMEPHSDVSAALFDRLSVKNMSMHLARVAMMEILGLEGTAWLNDHAETSYDNFTVEGLERRAKEAGIYLVFPDAGADKRYSKQTKYDKVITCSKKRDFSTGRITSIKVNDPEDAKDCVTAIIVDDLSSRGGTFVGAAEEMHLNLPELDKVYLCVTHCENAIYDGFIVNGPQINKVYTTNSILTRMPETDDEKAKLIVENVF